MQPPPQFMPQGMYGPPPMMPPPGMPPPMMPPGMFPPGMLPPGMFRPQKSFARVIFTTLASVLFGLSLTLNIYLLAFGGLTGGLGGSKSGGIIQSVEIAGDPEQKIAVIPIAEPIWEPTARKFDAMMSAVEEDANVRAVVLYVETPGGTVTASDEIYERINRFRQTMQSRGRKVPVVVSMGAIAASGGYYVSCAADYVMAQRTTITGSIGVIFPMVNASELAKKYGVQEISIAAPPNGMKNAGSWLSPLEDEEKQYFQGLADDFYATFVSVVEQGRGGKIKPPPGRTPQGQVLTTRQALRLIADGRVYTANEAMQMGLIDQIGYPSEAYDKAAALAGISPQKKHVVRYSPKPPTIFELLGAQSSVGPATAEASGGRSAPITINGVNVNLDVRALIDELGRPRPMYLWRGQ